MLVKVLGLAEMVGVCGVRGVRSKRGLLSIGLVCWRGCGGFFPFFGSRSATRDSVDSNIWLCVGCGVD